MELPPPLEAPGELPVSPGSPRPSSPRAATMFDGLVAVDDACDDGSAYAVGEGVLALNEGVWYPSTIAAVSSRSRKRVAVPIYKVHYDGWAPRWDEWVELGDGKVRRRTAAHLEAARESLRLAEAEEAEERAAKRRKSEEAKRRSSGGAKGAGSRVSHPPYAELVSRALYELRDKGGASPAAVAKWVLANYPVHETKYKSSVAAALKGLVAAGKLVKVKNSYKFTAKEQRLREAKATGLPVLPPPRKERELAVDDLVLEEQLRSQGIAIPKRPEPTALELVCPGECAADLFAVAEFCRQFDGILFGPSRGSRVLGVSELDAALGCLPGAEAPPLLERLALCLLRVVCGRDPASGAPDAAFALEAEQLLFVGHAQNRRIWGHVLNALTWPDVLRRHLGAERRYRRRLADAYPSALGRPARPAWVHPSVLEADAAKKARDEAEQRRVADEAAKKARDEAEAAAAAARRRADDDRRAAEQAALQRQQAAAAQAALALNGGLLPPMTVYPPGFPGQPFAMLAPGQPFAPAGAFVGYAAAAPPPPAPLAPRPPSAREKKPTPKSEPKPKRKRSGEGGAPRKRASSAVGPVIEAPPPPAEGPEPPRHPFDGAVDGDPAVLGAALYAFCEERTAFCALKPAHAVALLKHLVDDAVATPALQHALQASALLLDHLGKEAKATLAARRKAERALAEAEDEDECAALQRELAAAKAASEAAAEALADAEASRSLRRDALGDDRRWARHWALDCDDAGLGGPPRARLVVRLHGGDPRAAAGGPNLWRVFDRAEPVAKALNDRGAREGPLADALRKRAEALEAAPRPPPPEDAPRDARLAAALERPPAAESRAARLPWPGGDVDDGAPRRSSRIMNVATTSSTPLKKERTDFDAVEKRALRAVEAAAPWRCDLDDLGDACRQYAAELADLTVRVAAIAAGSLPPDDEAPRSEDDPALRDLAGAALDAEQRLYDFIHHGREAAFEKEAKEAPEAPPGDNDALPVSELVEVDVVSERDYYELVGACSDFSGSSDVGSHRALWRNTMASVAAGAPAAESADRRTFATLYLGLKEQVARHLGPLEARVAAASRLLLGDDDEMGGDEAGGKQPATSAVFVPSRPTANIVWARIRGYPWWPARLHEATAPKFQEALERKKQSLVVFVGESIQYFLSPVSVAPFTGAPDDPKLPKQGKATSKGLPDAIRVARAALVAAGLAPANGAAPAPAPSPAPANGHAAALTPPN